MGILEKDDLVDSLLKSTVAAKKDSAVAAKALVLASPANSSGGEDATAPAPDVEVIEAEFGDLQVDEDILPVRLELLVLPLAAVVAFCH